MAQIGRPGLSSGKKEELWARFKAGESFTAIGSPPLCVLTKKDITCSCGIYADINHRI
jgi:hypothetical protein